MLIDKNSSIPLYIQLYNSIKKMIESEQLKEGEKLPSIRSLAKELNVNNITVVNAYNLLEKEGYIFSVKGSGTYVRYGNYDEPQYLEDNRDVQMMAEGVLPISKDCINFASVSPTPELFPIEEFKQSLIEVLDRDKGKAFVYPEINGYEPFRISISSFLNKNYHMNVDKDQVVVISGGQQGIDIITKTLVSPGDYILVENPTYSAAIASFKSRGAKIIGIPILEDGIDIDVLDEYAKKYKPKFLYMMTNYQSPTTYSYSEEKKKELIRLSEKYNFYVIEDDFLTDLSYDNKKNEPLKSIDNLDKVIYIKSFSKIFMPGLRIGFLTVPKDLLTSIIKAKHTSDISSSGFLQRAFDLYLRKGYWQKHIENIKRVYAKKYNTMTEELKKLNKYNISFHNPKGGLSLWIRLPEEIDAIDLYNECIKSNLAVVPGKIFFVDDSLYSNYIRVSFSAVSDEEIVQGISILENNLKKKFTANSNKYIPFV
jgi:DNA-binding transcriptional MocR family regulator